MIKEEIHVEYIDHLGSDLNVVNAARVSFHKEQTEIDEEKDTKLINYLAKHNHWSPLAHTSIQIRVTAPIFLARQFVKHQIGLVWNEVSRRYVDDEPTFWFPEVWHGRPVNAKQGSSDDVIDLRDNGFEASRAYYPETLVKLCLDTYNEMLRAGVAPEEARIILPQNTMTTWIWTGSLVAYDRIRNLRVDSHAQRAAQELGSKIVEVVAPVYPISWKALSN